jgi:pyruvate dehydrogenase complex dehydrogenase (E1) component
MNLFILLSALGLSHSINGERLLPIGTLYDPFIAKRRSHHCREWAHGTGA